MPTTLNDYATNEKNTYQTAVTLAQADLKAAQDQLRPSPDLAVPPPPTKVDTLEDARRDFKTKEEDIAAKRKRLAVTTVPSEASALIEDIADRTMELNALQHEVLEAKAAVDREGARAAHAQSRLTRATAKLAAVETKRAALTVAGNARTALLTAIAGPLAGVPQAATDLLASPLTTSARAKLDATHFPEKLLEVARRRFLLWRNRSALARSRVDAASAALGAHQDANAGLSGDAIKTQLDFARAESDVRWFAGTAQERLARARAAIERLAQGGDVLTARELSDALLPAALVDRNAAEAKEVVLLDAQKLLDDADLLVENARTVARAANINATPAAIDAVTEVVNALAVRTPLAQAVSVADAGYSAGERTTVREWQALVPTEAWKRVLDFIEAEALLTELSTTNIAAIDPNSLQGRLNTAEGLYGDALAAVAAAERAIASYDDAIAEQQAVLEASRVEERTRLLSAVRGDSI